MNHNEEDTLDLFNRLPEKLHQTDGNNPGSIVFNIYEKGSMHVDHVDHQHFYGDKWAKALQHEPAACPSSAEPVFDQDTPLSALFREHHHEELRQTIEAWRPYLIGDDTSVDVLAMTHFEFDRKRIYSNRVYYDLLDLEDLGALQVPLSQLASYLADHSNLSQSYETLYRQLKKYRQERS